ncbi:RagB/SusD family nutrient uptake outer membrane protein [Pedobacter sp. UBA4863]|uniref:RagB/SusD family nutrient uptake outer membrane protein n=1 Tax=Pedobacter sp. UBA4863 TaxID=1947060 RepID=UPI0025DA3820|nr:RagB/SusD family nutrient uptake outer membrane protein [Pedobacter sp. UBA4863]
MKTKSNYTSCQTILFLFSFYLLFIVGCKKQDEWLDVKRQKSDVVPKSLKDLQAVLDNTTSMNKNFIQLTVLGTDNISVTDANLSASSEIERNTYIWNKDIFNGQMNGDWTVSYTRVAYTNIVLDALTKIVVDDRNRSNYNNVKGSALFYRAFVFYELLQMFAKPYDAGTAATDLGIPLRQTSDINAPSLRANLQKCYDQITEDLTLAIGLLPETPLYLTRPSSISARALLAKVYLTMGNYTLAGDYANRALQKSSTLVDFNSTTISTALPYRFPTFRACIPEIIFYAEAGLYLTTGAYVSGTGNVDASLYESYDDHDLRKSIFYQNYGGGKVKFQGTYTGTTQNFSGLATNEIYLIRAECYARNNNTTLAMADLNTLMNKRYATGSFSKLVASTPEEALTLILRERRKELPFTAQIRWEDLRRLNKDSRYAKQLQRIFSGQTYTLPPNDRRYVFPIPDLEIQTYGIPQNVR